jgi:DNA polymerase III epsilon subunit-like protein
MAGKPGLRVYLDVETTGLEAGPHRIVEVGAVVYENAVEMASFSSLANPGEGYLRDADPEAMRVSGITPEEVRGAPPDTEVAPKLRAFLEAHPGPLHAFGVGFDRKFLCLDPWKIGWPLWGECIQQMATEIMGRGGVLDRRGGGWRWASLAAAMGYFGVRVQTLHRGLPDARGCARVHQEILEDRKTEHVEDEATNMLDGGM